MNNTTKPVDLFWVNSSKIREKYTPLDPGEIFSQNTFSGHVFVAGKLAFTATQKPAIAYLDSKPLSEPTLSKNGKPTFKNNNLFADGVQLTYDGTAKNRYAGPTFQSPDGRYLIAMREKMGTNRQIDLIEAAPKDQLQPKRKTIRYPKPGDEIDVRIPHLFDLKTGTEILLDYTLLPNPWSLNTFSWNLESSYFYFIYNQRGHQILRLLSIEVATGKIATVLEETSSTFIDYSRKLSLTYLNETHEALWMSERSGWNHLYLIDLKTGTTTPITRPH